MKNKHYKMEIQKLENEYTEKEIKRLKRMEKPIDYSRVFEGVGEWLGKEYMEIPHININKNEWTVGPSDFLFIPEAFSSLMKQCYQKKAPCKRIALLHNFDYVTDFVPYGDEWATYGIIDAVVSTKKQDEQIRSVFPYLYTKILNPRVSDEFRMPIKPKKLIVNIISKRTQDVEKITKIFAWKYPLYNFISFRDVRGYPKELYAEMLRESAITVWIDSETPFGLSALEAMRCGNIVVGKIPETVPEWMGNSTELFNNGLWTFDINQIPDMLVKVIGTWMRDKMPEELLKSMEETNKKYTTEEWEKNVTEVMDSYINEQIKHFKTIQEEITKKNTKDNE
jgi:hypothetical protein